MMSNQKENSMLHAQTAYTVRVSEKWNMHDFLMSIIVLSRGLLHEATSVLCTVLISLFCLV